MKGQTKKAVGKWELTCVSYVRKTEWITRTDMWEDAFVKLPEVPELVTPCWRQMRLGKMNAPRHLSKVKTLQQHWWNTATAATQSRWGKKLSFLPVTQKLKGNLIISLLQDSQSFNYWKSGETYSNLISLEKSCCLYWQNLCHWWEISHSDFKSSCSLAAWFIKLMGHFLLSPLRIRSVHW